jgi:hypothetical protein
MTAAAAPVNFDIGRVISAGFGLVGHRWRTLVVLAALFSYLPFLASAWGRDILVPPPLAAGSTADFGALFRRLGLLELLAFVFSGVTWLMQGGVALCAVADAGGRTLDVGELLSRLLRRAPTMYALGVISAVATLLGYLLIIVPGVLLALAWCLGPAVAALEDRGFLGVFSRSAELTRGYRAQLFGLFLILGFAALFVGLGTRLLVGAPLLANGEGDPVLLKYGLQPLVSAAFSMVSASVFAAAYLELRGVKEGATAQAFAATFD